MGAASKSISAQIDRSPAAVCTASGALTENLSEPPPTCPLAAPHEHNCWPEKYRQQVAALRGVPTAADNRLVGARVLLELRIWWLPERRHQSRTQLWSCLLPPATPVSSPA